MPVPSFRARLAISGLTVSGVLLVLLLAGYGLASAASAVAGVQIRPAAAAQSGARGAVITYTLRMTNTGTVADVYTMTFSGYSWPTTFTVNGAGSVLLPLAPNHGQNVLVFVTIPLTATGHDVALFHAQSGNNPSVAASATLTTSVILKLYLPLVRK